MQPYESDEFFPNPSHGVFCELSCLQLVCAQFGLTIFIF